MATHAACQFDGSATLRVRALQLGLVGETTICWTPVETVSVLDVPAAHRAVLPASWARVHWEVLSGEGSVSDGNRFSPAIVTVNGTGATVLEYASGCMPMLMLQRALLHALVTASPSAVLATPLDIAAHSLHYARGVLLPPLAASFARISAVLDAPLAYARRFASRLRSRRDRARKHRGVVQAL